MLGMPGASVGREHIAPGQKRRSPRAAAEIDHERFHTRMLEPSFASHEKTVVRQLDHRALCAGRKSGGAAPPERERETRRGGKASLEVHGEAVRRDDVEANPGEQHDSARHGVRVARGEVLVDRDLAGQVQVVRPGAKAAFDDRSRRAHERAGAVEHDAHVAKRIVHRRGSSTLNTRCAVPSAVANRSIAAALRPARIGSETLFDGQTRDDVADKSVGSVHENAAA